MIRYDVNIPTNISYKESVNIREINNYIKAKSIKCPCCKHKTIIVFNDTKGHIQVKCRKCKREIMMNIV